MSKIRTLIVRVGHDPAVETIDDDLDTMQGIVGGYVEAIRLSDGVDLWINEDGIAQGRPANRHVRDGGTVWSILGDFFLARCDMNGDTTSLTETDIAKWTKALKAASDAPA